MNNDTPLELISVQVAPLATAVTTEASTIMLRFPHGAHLELSTAVSPRWLANCCDAWLDRHPWANLVKRSPYRSTPGDRWLAGAGSANPRAETLGGEDNS